jgi:hypothetical protein
VEYKNECHWMLLRLAGRAPDELITRSRALLAEENAEELGRVLTSAVSAGRVRLTDDEVDLLSDLVVSAELDLSELVAIDIVVGVPELRHTFGPAPRPGSAERSGPADAVALQAAQAQGAVRALWRVWRTGGDGGAAAARVVYVVETDEGADLPAVTGAIQSALSDAGETDPQVETYPVQGDLPRYQRLARGSGALLWTREPAPEVRMAKLFDGVDAGTGPFMRPDHPTVDDDAERANLVRYLTDGRPLLVTTALMDDVVDTARGRRVPMSFRTDGEWIWTDATTYYLAEHHLLPDPALADHIRVREFQVPEVDGAGMHRAMAKLTEPAQAEPAWTYR